MNVIAVVWASSTFAYDPKIHAGTFSEPGEVAWESICSELYRLKRLIPDPDGKFKMIDLKRKDFIAADPEIADFIFVGRVNFMDTLELFIRTKPADETRSKYLHGNVEFSEMMSHFSKDISNIQGHWIYGSNLEEFNRLVRSGLSVGDAAKNTWTGKQAARYGFNNVVVVKLVGDDGAFTEVKVRFKK